MNAARTALVVVAMLAFIGIGVIAIIQHDPKAGVASVLLAIVNGLLLS